jgi:hypothetical protein
LLQKPGKAARELMMATSEVCVSDASSGELVIDTRMFAGAVPDSGFPSLSATGRGPHDFNELDRRART